MTAENIIRQKITFTGRVQGVGFRYRAKYAASASRLTGWVKNEWDGSVLMEVQGTPDNINKMLKTINSSPYIDIHWLTREPLPLEEHESGFHIR
ncbi:MAG: acylphosphatase [Clostridiales bacterium]|nr:acylphosphatase [Candidatus Blautia equi]